MTEKQKKFIEEYGADNDATQAALRAGYSIKTARRAGEENLKNPLIIAVLDAIDAEEKNGEPGGTQTEKSKDAANIAEIVDYLTAIMRGECGAETESGSKLGVKDRVKAAELLGKHFGMFSDKLNIEGVVPVILGGGDELEE